MDAFTYYKTKDRAKVIKVCESAGTNFAYFQQVALGHRRFSVDLAIKLELASKGEMSLRELLPRLDTQHKRRKSA